MQKKHTNQLKGAMTKRSMNRKHIPITLPGGKEFVMNEGGRKIGVRKKQD